MPFLACVHTYVRREIEILKELAGNFCTLQAILIFAVPQMNIRSDKYEFVQKKLKAKNTFFVSPPTALLRTRSEGERQTPLCRLAQGMGMVVLVS